MTKPLKKTNAARLLDEQGIAYTLRQFTVNEADLSATAAAAALDAQPEQVFKTLVARGDRTGVLLACIPGNAELALKSLAQLSGNKSVSLVHLKEVLGLTGYVRGGCSPIGTKKEYPVFIDASAKHYEHIYVSAGQRGVQFFITPEDLATATRATFGEIAGTA